MKTHRLKTLAPYWDRVYSGEKTFEIRKNDRDFQVGDVLELERIETEKVPINSFVPNAILKVDVRYILCGGQYGLEIGYCIMAIELKEEYKTYQS